MTDARIDQTEFVNFLRTIASGNDSAALTALHQNATLAQVHAEVGASRAAATEYFIRDIQRYLYRGDTALHIASAAYRAAIVHALIVGGAGVDAANRLGATALHAAAAGSPDSIYWNPRAQAEVINLLIDAGADPNAPDKRGVTPLHIAVRTRCASAVDALLERGADIGRTNRSGSTPARLAVLTTGRGGSGSPAAREQQQTIVAMLQARAARVDESRAHGV
ncbi:MAG TPA: ankyrin repeat domain-containing protein [Gemmatimonadaceae bacterium]|jgi:ankyrin repeat protein